MRKEISEKPVHTIIPRNELITEQAEMRSSPKGYRLREFLKDLAPQAPSVGNKPEKAAFRENGGQSRER